MGGPAGEKALKPSLGWSSYSMQVYSSNGPHWISAATLKAQSDAMTYDGTWQRNGNFEVPAVSEPLTVAVSDSGAKSSAVGTRTIEVNNDSSQIVYTGSWSRSTGRGLGASQGDVDIYVDGQFKQTVSTYREDGRGAQQVVYSISDLLNGTHTIRGVKKSGQFMLLDKLNVR